MMSGKALVEPANPTRCYEHFHMTMTEYALYDVARAWSGKTGILYFDGKKLSQQFERASKSNMYKLAGRLTKKGWFVIHSEPSRRGNGTWSPRTYKVLRHVEWC